MGAALERRAEVMQAIWDSEDSEAAVAGIRLLLTCDEVAARAVLDLSWHRLTRQNRERIWQEREEQTRHLAEG